MTDGLGFVSERPLRAERVAVWGRLSFVGQLPSAEQLERAVQGRSVEDSDRAEPMAKQRFNLLAQLAVRAACLFE